MHGAQSYFSHSIRLWQLYCEFWKIVSGAIIEGIPLQFSYVSSFGMFVRVSRLCSQSHPTDLSVSRWVAYVVGILENWEPNEKFFESAQRWNFDLYIVSKNILIELQVR